MSGVTPSNNGFGNRWSLCYSNMEQLRVVLVKTEETAEGNKNLRWACRIFQLYMWLHLIDQYGDIPYSEALKGAPELGGILMPKFDKEQDVYPDLIAKLKAIGDEMAAGFGDDEIGDGDILFDGDVEKWQRFCNSLRLRAAMRLSGVSSALAKTHIEEIAGNPTRYPLIDNNDDNVYFWWTNSLPYFEPWYNNSRSRDDHTFFETFIDHLIAMEDPRIASIAKLAANRGKLETDPDDWAPEYNVYRGLLNGISPSPSNRTLYSRIGRMYRDIPAGFTPFYKSCETFYILAEAAMLGWNVGMTAEEAYEEAVLLSMEDNNVDEEDAEEYLAGKGKWDGTKERIWWDQWVALFKENMEAWCLYRRTGIPTPEVNYFSKFSKMDHNSQPFRTPYPQNQLDYNKPNYLEANNGIVDFAWGKQLWWDTRTGVH